MIVTAVCVVNETAWSYMELDKPKSGVPMKHLSFNQTELAFTGWATPSLIYIVLHIIFKLNSLIVLSFIVNISKPTLILASTEKSCH